MAKPFVKGDPRINRKGRPKSFDALRALAQQIAHEEAQSKGEPIIINGHVVTVAEMILRNWARDAKLQAHFIEIAFGKVPENIDITSKGEKLNGSSNLLSRLLPKLAAGDQEGTDSETKQD